MVKKRHYPPAYYRYNEKSKTISIRFRKEDYDKLEAMAKVANKSIADFIRSTVLNFREELNNTIENVYNIGYADGINGKPHRYRQNGVVVGNGNEEE